MDSKQTALVTAVVLSGIGLLAASCSDDPETVADHHGKSGGHEMSTHAPEHDSKDHDDADKDEDSDHDHDAKSEEGHAVATVWGYEGGGAPQHWGELSEEYSACANGKSQSPIDFSSVTMASLPTIQFNYKPSSLEIVNTGHTIMVNYPAGSSISVDGKNYELMYVDFHSPSEHTVGGKAYDMVAHLIHKSDDDQYGVVGVMFEAGNKVNTAIAKLWLNIPDNAGDKSTAHDLHLDASDLLPESQAYYNYSGSFTVPPCSEGVEWFVMSTPVHIAKEQVKQFAERFPMSARPVQPLNGREVRVSN